jgi:hypothetical protein
MKPVDTTPQALAMGKIAKVELSSWLGVAGRGRVPEARGMRSLQAADRGRAKEGGPARNGSWSQRANGRHESAMEFESDQRSGFGRQGRVYLKHGWIQ